MEQIHHHPLGHLKTLVDLREDDPREPLTPTIEGEDWGLTAGEAGSRMYGIKEERIHLVYDDKLEDEGMMTSITQEMTSSDDVMIMSSPDDSRQDDEGDVSVKMTMPSMNGNGFKGAVESQDDVICGGGDDVESRDDVMSNDTVISGHTAGDTDDVVFQDE